MQNYKEIVTKAVIGKGKKHFRNTYTLTTDDNVDTVLGCWVINHNIKGLNNNGMVQIKGSFDVNIWYSYENNTKTNVINRSISYEELVSVKLKEDKTLTDNSEIIIRSLKNPSCTDVNVSEGNIEYVIEKELGIEIIGDTKVRIAIEDDMDDYDEIVDEEVLDSEIEKINEDYLEN